MKKPGIDVDLMDPTGGHSALIRAAELNWPEVFQLLLESGANPDLKDRQDGGTAMMRAIDYGYKSVIEISFNMGSTIDARTTTAAVSFTVAV